MQEVERSERFGWGRPLVAGWLFMSLIGLSGGTVVLVHRTAKAAERAETERRSESALINGLSALEHGQTARAEQHLRRCLEVDPDRIRASVVLAELLTEAGRHAEALTVINAARARPSGVDRVRRRSFQGDGFRSVTIAGSNVPEVPALEYVRGKVLLDLGRPAEALEAYTQAARMSACLTTTTGERPFDLASRQAAGEVHRAEALLALGRRDEARVVLQLLARPTSRSGSQLDQGLLQILGGERPKGPLDPKTRAKVEELMPRSMRDPLSPALRTRANSLLAGLQS